MAKKNSHVRVVNSGYVPSDKAKDRGDCDWKPPGLFPPIDSGPKGPTLGLERDGGAPYHIPNSKPAWGDQFQFERERKEMNQIMKRIRKRGKNNGKQ